MKPSDLLKRLHEFNKRPVGDLATMPDDELAHLYKATSDLFWALGKESTTRRLQLREILAKLVGGPEYGDDDQKDIDEDRDNEGLGGQRVRR